MLDGVLFDIAAFLVVISIIVIIHEFGHFITAKKIGVKVEKFSLGFGPKVFGKKIGETEYVLSLLPLGGYVKLLGEDPSEELSPEDQKRSYSHLPPYKKFLVIFAGPFFNFILALIVFFVIFMTGRPVLKPVVGGVMKNRPAAMAGLQKGDVIVSVGGKAVKSWGGLSSKIEKSAGSTLKLGVKRPAAGKSPSKVFYVNIKAVKVKGLNVLNQKIDRYVIGIYPSNQTFYVYGSLWSSFVSSVKEIWFVIYITFVSLYYLILGKLPASDLGGPIMIAQLSGRAASLGVSDFFYFVAFISVNIGLVNLLPIPALDGGHLLFSVIEMIKRSPLSVKFQENAAKVGFAFLILLLLFVSYNDIIRAFKT